MEKHQTILYIISVIMGVQVLPIALGFDSKEDKFRVAWFSLVMLLGQLLMFIAGFLLGNRFMHLLDNYIGTVVFAGLFLVGARFIMEAFKVRKGERTYAMDSSATVVLASLAQGINTFLFGILASAIVETRNLLLTYLAVATVIALVLGIILKRRQISFTFASFLYFSGGLLLLFGAVYLGFFA
jgi:putative Mn2+ efflux pump MntP